MNSLQEFMSQPYVVVRSKTTNFKSPNLFLSHGSARLRQYHLLLNLII